MNWFDDLDHVLGFYRRLKKEKDVVVIFTDL
jgi:hypothetical protein